MKAIDRPFSKIINGAMQFVIPVFQRDYSWTETQCERLWDDILLIARSKADRGHFLGSVVYIPTDDSAAGFTRWLLIDGQQRVTTLMILLSALRDYIKDQNWSGAEDDPTVAQIEAYFLKNSYEKGDRHHKLVLRRRDQSGLKAAINGDADWPDDASDRIVDNYEYFYDQLKEADPAEVYRGIGRLIVVDVVLDKGTDDPQLIFESLNSTGVDLSQSDLIRNFILMKLPEKEQTQLYESHWSKIENLFHSSGKIFDGFVRDYLALKTQASKQEKSKQIYQGFRRNFPGLLQAAGDLEDFLSDMLRYANYYSAFSVSGEAFPGLKDNLERLCRLVDVPAILVMRLFDCYERLETLTRDEFSEALTLIESYVFRRVICGAQTRGYWQVFANLAYRIDEENPLESLMVGLACQNENYRYPSDEEFYKELQSRDLYGMRNCFYMLERLENWDNKEPTNTSSYSVEHVLPQNKKLSTKWKQMLGGDWKSIQEKWLHRLGNLTLTGYNSKYSDHAFHEKKTMEGGFEDSSVRLNKFIREQGQWTELQIEQRGVELAKRSLSVWPPLIVDQTLIDAANIADLEKQAAKRDPQDVSMSEEARALYNLLHPVIEEMEPDALRVAETKSISYHATSFFLEVLPRKRRLLLLLPLDYNEVEDPDGVAADATEWKFFFYAKYDGGVTVEVADEDDLESALPIIRQALKLAQQ